MEPKIILEEIVNRDHLDYKIVCYGAKTEDDFYSVWFTFSCKNPRGNKWTKPSMGDLFTKVPSNEVSYTVSRMRKSWMKSIDSIERTRRNIDFYRKAGRKNDSKV